MCLAIPGKVLTIEKDATPVMGNVSVGGTQKKVGLEWVPEVRVGDYVIVHVGFALSTVDEAEALETLKMFKEMEDLGSGEDDEIRR